MQWTGEGTRRGLGEDGEAGSQGPGQSSKVVINLGSGAGDPGL